MSGLISTYSASALDQDLDDFSTSVNTALVSGGASASSSLPIYVIIDSDMSGTFMDDLGMVDGRVILSSTGETAFTGDNIRTGSLHDSYSYMLFSRLALLDSLATAHTYAESAVYSASSYQYPLIEADGDGIAGETADYTAASNAYIGYRSGGQYCPVVSVAKADASHTSLQEMWSSGFKATTSRTDASVVPTLRSCHRRAQGSRLRLSHLATAVIILALKLRLLTSPYLAATL